MFNEILPYCKIDHKSFIIHVLSIYPSPKFTKIIEFFKQHQSEHHTHHLKPALMRNYEVIYHRFIDNLFDIYYYTKNINKFLVIIMLGFNVNSSFIVNILRNYISREDCLRIYYSCERNITKILVKEMLDLM